MKKKLNYREKLIELADIYDVKEIKDYVKRRKNLTSGQLELILRKNKIIIPKDYKTSFFKENFTKPLGKFSKQIVDLKDDSSKSMSRLTRRMDYFKEDSYRKFNNVLYGTWKKAGIVGIEFLNIIPKLGKTYYNFFANFFTELFNGIYSQNFNKNKAGKAIIVFFITIGLGTVIFSSFDTFDKIKTSNENNLVKDEKLIKKPEINKPEIKKNENAQKKELQAKKEIKKQEPQAQKQNKAQKQKEKVAEIILPDLNLKTETVLNLFKDVDYNLNKVRYEKVVKPIYFTQFPKDLDEIQSVKLKKETFIKIVLPLIVAENEKILDDKYKLKKIISKKFTTDNEKQWLRQKFLEYKVKGGDVKELNTRMDIIPVSIALAQAAKESGWGTSRFALEGNAIFGQWTWNGKGIEPLLKDKSKNHKILKFPILRASVKAYQNNLNTHKSYVKFREKRKNLREKNKKINGLELSKTLSNYAQTGSEYIKILAKIIIQNRLMDFEPVKLANSVKRKELNL
tara:strand:- start:329 stop:1861 length:1533 start_codon:yes stop_codon:yes gene_type:complete